ncbi:MAG: TatD family hydrolase [Verrucomicrobiales bacterium]|nr:TatD family hydrolase [Verrucomicrobiales bacterium]
MAEFYDTHAHLDFHDFQPDLDQVVERALAAGITRILCVGTTLESSRRVVALAERFACVYAVVGVHPNHAHEEPEAILAPLRDLAAHPKVVALGETGVDRYRWGGLSPVEIEERQRRQASAFDQQLALAAELGLPCVIHQRDAFAAALSHLEPYRGRVPFVFHCFTGTVEEARAVLEAGGLLSFTGITTFKNAQNVRDALGVVPLGKLMLETDCPFLAPLPYRGKRCEPAFVRDLAPVVAEVKGCSLEALSTATCSTARAFFPRLH